jgi:hypothetical protein
MRDDEYEIVDVQEYTSKWWQNRRLTLAPGWWIVPLVTAVIGLPGLLLALTKAPG